MREIEFRAWLKDENKMIYVPIIDFRDKKIKTLYGQDCYEWNYSFDEIELMQYIGLKDKNGVKIFEGDIVLNLEEEIAVVVWNNVYGRFELDYGNYEVTLEHCCIVRYKVIGNIYENKELLNE